MRNRGGIILKLLAFLAVVFACVALGWMLFLPVVVTNLLRSRTGFDATIERLSVNPLTGAIELRGFIITNPPTFPVREFIELREFRANADVISLFSDRPVFDSMTIDLASVTLVKSRDGATNAEVFEHDLNSPGTSPTPHPRTAAPTKKYLIRKLALRIDRLVIADHSLRRPSVRDFRLGIDQNYLDVSDLKQLFAPAVLKNLAPVAAAAGGLLPGDWGQAVGAAAKSGTDLLREAGQKAGEKVKGYFDALEESKKP